MHGEAPEFKRCCFCLPLRRGLIGWGYAKLVLSLLMMAYIIFEIIRNHRWQSFDAGEIAIMAAFLMSLTIDLSLNILFIVAGHKKSVKLLNIAYVYNLVWLGLVLLGNCFILYENLRRLYRIWGPYGAYNVYLVLDAFIESGIASGVFFVQIYLILLVRSEIKKLRNQSLEMQFSNHLVSGEPQCILHNGSDRDGTGKKEVARDCCSGKKEATQDCCTGMKEATQDR